MKFSVEFLCPKCRSQCFSSWSDQGTMWRKCTSEGCNYRAAEHDDHIHFVIRYDTLHGYKEQEELYLRNLSRSINAAAEKKKEPPPDPKKDLN